VHVEGEESAEVALHHDVVVQEDHPRKGGEHAGQVESPVVEQGEVLGVVELHEVAGISVLLLKAIQYSTVQYSRVL